MPRKKSQPVAAAIEAAEQQPAQHFDGGLPEQQPFGDAYEPPSVTAADADFPVPDGAFVRMTAAPAKVFGVSLYERQGIRIDVERERQPGQVGPRVLIKFRNDMPPNDAEKAVLRAEGFSYSAADKAWCAPKSAAALVVAKRAVNKITHELRGDEGAALFV